MAKNYIQSGAVVTLAAPYDVSGGGGLQVGSIFGVASGDAVSGADVEAMTSGVFDLPKATGAIAQGTKVYWDNTNKNVTTTASGNTLIGAATVAVVSGDATVQVKLNGTV